MGYLNNSGLARFWNAIKSKFIRTINGIGPDTNGNVSVDTCEFINGTQTAATGSFTGVSRDSSLYDGKHIIYRLPYAGSGNATLNLTLADGTTTGAKNVWRAPGTRLTTHYAAGNFLGMTYFQFDDSWHCDVDVDTDSFAYGVRLYYSIYKAKTAVYRYQIMLTRDEDTLLPVNAVDNNVGTTKQLTTAEFDPFGEIYWYWTTTVINAGSYIAGSNLLSQYWLVDLRYSFNTGTTLTAYKDVYLVCEPRPNGKAVLAPNPISQTLPSSEDGYVYIRLGKAYDTYRITLDLHKPRYYYANGEIREWTNSPVDAKLAEYNTDEDVFQIRHAKAEKPSYNSEVVRKITGGTVAWNQMISSDHKSYTNPVTDTRTSIQLRLRQQVSPYTAFIATNVSSSESIDKIFNSTFTGYIMLLHNGSTRNLDFIPYSTYSVITGHKYYFHFDILSADPTTVGGVQSDNLMLFDLTQTFGSTIADRIYALEQATAGAGVAWFRRYFNLNYYEHNQTLANTYFDQYTTTGMNLWDEQWDVGSVDGTTGAYVSGIYLRSKYKIRVVSGAMYYMKKPNNMNAWLYFYDANGSFVPWGSAGYMLLNYTTHIFTVPNGCVYVAFLMDSSYGTTYNHDICINLSDASRNGQYEPYRYSRITFFDNPVLLRGIPYLDENDNLRFNGDTLEANRKINRRYGIVNLGALNWVIYNHAAFGQYFYTDASSLGVNRHNAYDANSFPSVCDKYIVAGRNTSTFVDKTYCFDGTVSNVTQIQIKDSAYTDATTFKAAMSGVYLVYELKTPTEEEFTPIDGPLVSDPLGLEVIAKSDWDDTPILAQMDILYANEVRANVEMIETNKVIASQNSAKDLSKCVTVKPGKMLANGTDLNTVKTFGEYYLRVPGTNYSYPNAAFRGNSKLLVIDMQGSDYDDPMYNGGVMQIQIGEIYDSTTGVRTNKAYSRIYYSGTTWSSWKPIQGGSGLFYGSSATAAGTATKDVVCPEFTAVDLVPGTTISVKFDNTNSAAVGSLALNVNGTGAHNVKYVYNGSYSDIPVVGYIKAGQLYLFTYDGTYWVVQMMYNTYTHPYYLFLTDAKRKAYTNLYRYQVCFTKDEEYILPANAIDNNIGTSKQLTTEAFDPFGPIFYYNTTTTVAANGLTAVNTLYFATAAVDLRYAFNTGTSLVANKQVYLKCQPQSDGKVKLATTNPIVQALPTTEDGYVYILLGVAYDTYRICFFATKPIYHCVNGEIREWTKAPYIPAGGSANQVLKKLSADDYDYDWETLDVHNIPSGGSSGQVLTKNSATNYDASWKTPASTGLPTGGSIGQVLAKKTATNYDVEWISPPSGVKIYNITYNSSTHTYALPDTFANVRNQFLVGNLVILSNNGLMYYLSEASASVLVFTTAVSDDYFVYRLEWLSSDTAIGQATELSLYNNYVPSGGTTGQFLVKKSNTNFDLQWVTVPNANGVSF